MAGEIIVGSGSGTDRERASRDATDLRERARSQRTETAPAVPLSSVVDELDDGPFSGRSAPAATDNRQRARTYQKQGNETPSGNVGGIVTPSAIEQLMVDPDSNQGRVKSNINRARAYQRGESPGVTNPAFGGTENLPLVDCKDTGSVTGRIGDDNISGAVIVVMRNGKGVKVRCR